MACQIAKLRFFISLAIEQEPDRDASNFGIKPLPNLETRFVAANTLIGLKLSETRLLLQEDSVQRLIKEIEGIREKHFLTNNRQRKLDLEEQEDEFRAQCIDTGFDLDSRLFYHPRQYHSLRHCLPLP